ncbi:MAG: class I SAM-dependent methyltransferase [Desulforhopalus sp.]
MNMNLPCRFCNSALKHTFLDLGMSPLANSYLEAVNLYRMEPFYPLHVFFCEECLLVQLTEFESSEAIFSDYAYFSSFSESWLKHSEDYTLLMIDRFGLKPTDFVVEVASNDGYLLQYFKEKGIPVLGIEPAENVAKVAIEAGIPSLTEFFGTQTATKLANGGQKADLLLGNNVLAHVPDLNDFVKGLKILLNDDGVITMEFPHLLQLVEKNQFDTIYHEHFSYFSFTAVQRVFKAHGLELFDVDMLPTHGGSLRIYGRHTEDSSKEISENVYALLDTEKKKGMTGSEFYVSFAEKVKSIKREILQFLIREKGSGKNIVAYGAPAKGNTLLNYCGIGTDFIDYTVDLSPHKQGKYLPGTHIPIHPPEQIFKTKPDYVILLPWNLKEEIMGQMSAIREWGGRFVTLIPSVEVID